MLVGLKKIHRLLPMVLLLGAVESTAQVAAEGGGRCQDLTGAYEGVQYCQIPIHALLANSVDYKNRNVAVFGYLFHGEEGGDVLGPSADALRRIDFIACAAVDLDGVRYEDSSDVLEPGIYFAMVQGVYVDGAVNGACVGSIERPIISRVSKVEEAD